MLSSFDIPGLETMNDLLPEFEFTGLIAASDHSAVYEATHRALERAVAIKILSPEVSENPASRHAFESTSRIMAKLKHLNLIGVYNSGCVGDMLYVVMEFVAGQSLDRAARGISIELSQVLQLVTGISAGLLHAHEHGVIHGHLKPSTILVNQRIEPKIGNFGFAHPDERPDSDVSSPYTAPEIISNPSAPSPLGDIYAVGAIFYELVTGQPHSPDPPPPSSLSNVGQKIDSILRLATHPDPNSRFQNMSAFLDSLQSLPSHQRPELTSPLKNATTQIRFHPVSPPIRRHKSASSPPAYQSNFVAPLNPAKAIPLFRTEVQSPRPKAILRTPPGKVPPPLRKPNN